MIDDKNIRLLKIIIVLGILLILTALYELV
jgi:hypothetical protein